MKTVRLLFLTMIIVQLSPINCTAQNGNWTWIGGDSVLNSHGKYGTEGITAPGNMPHSRYEAHSWKDLNGDFWLFGGFPWCDDLWKYHPASNEWTWVGGDTVSYINGVYGMLGMAAPNNKPGGRFSGLTWTDATGNLWLFGGDAFPATGGNYGYANDLWKYNITTNQWTWMSGDSTVNNTGVYGAMGVASGVNKPGGRRYSQGWADNNGNLWLYGGDGYDATQKESWALDDLWEYNISANQWTWVKGDTFGTTNMVYGTMGQPDIANTPGGREDAVTWADNSGNLWLFGGNFGYHNDLWKYNIATNEWTWVNGSNTNAAVGQYGTQGLPAAGNQPGGRQSMMGWKDSNGNFWMLGGEGRDDSYPYVWFDDLWKYDLSANLWTWMKGDSLGNINGVYGTLGLTAPANKPGSRIAPTGWADDNGNLWLFGGYGYPASGASQLSSSLNDLWKFDPGVVTTAPVAAFGISADTICAGDTVSFTDHSTGSPGSWRWAFTGGTPGTSTTQNPKVVYNTPGTFDVKLWVSNSGGSDSLTRAGYIVVNPQPAVGLITGTGTICSGDTARILYSGGNGSVEWYTGTGPSDLFLAQADTSSSLAVTGLSQTTYFLVSDSNSCGYTFSNELTVMVAPLPLVDSVAGASPVCAGDSVHLSVTGTNGYLQWYSGANTSSRQPVSGANSSNYFAPALTQTTYFSVSDSNSCGVVYSGKYAVTVNPLPVAFLNPLLATICSGDSISVCTTKPFASYSWNTTDTTPCTTVTAAGGVWVTVTDANHCSAVSGHTLVSVYPPTFVSIVHQGDTLSSFGHMKYLWIRNNEPINGGTGSVYVATQPGSYAVQVTDTNGCTATSEAILISGISPLSFAEGPGVSIYPNPNSIGSWELGVTNELVGAKLEVYDDEGRVVFNSELPALPAGRKTQNSKLELNIPSGIYYLRISNDKVSVVRKLVKL